MTEPNKKFIVTAVVFRNIFIVVFILLLILAIVIAYLGIKKLQTTADDVRMVVAEASAIDQTNTRTVTLWNEIQQNQQAVTRAGQVVAESKSYAYQDVIVRDLKNFAKKAGITITNYDFTVGNSSGSGSGSGAPAETTQPADGGTVPTAEDAAGAGAGPAGQTPPVASTLKTTSVSVTIETPVDYQRLLRFVNYIEQNLTKMQISQVSLSRVTSEGRGKINSDALTIEVYIR